MVSVSLSEMKRFDWTENILFSSKSVVLRNSRVDMFCLLTGISNLHTFKVSFKLSFLYLSQKLPIIRKKKPLIHFLFTSSDCLSWLCSGFSACNIFHYIYSLKKSLRNIDFVRKKKIILLPLSTKRIMDLLIIIVACYLYYSCTNLR